MSDQRANETPANGRMVDDVYATMLDSIVQARLGAGTPLSQNKLAARLGVSRTPVREALLRLEREGLVERVPDAGFVVAGITVEEVNELCDLIVLLDTFVYSRAATILSADQLQELVDTAREMVQHAEVDDVEGWEAADHGYHDVVMSAAGNRFAADALREARQRVQRFGVPRRTDGRLVSCSMDHLALAEAMRGGDTDALSELVTGHIERTRTAVLNRLEQLAPLTPSLDPLARVV